MAISRRTAVMMITAVATVFLILPACALGLQPALMEQGSVLWSLFILGPTLLLLTWYDLTEYRLPNLLTIPLIAAGFAFAWNSSEHDLILSVLGAIVGYGLVFGLQQLYLRFRGQEGIGLGDGKLLAAGGAWLGILGLGPILLLSSVLGMAFFGVTAFFNANSLEKKQYFPFGPFLAVSIWALSWPPFSQLVF